MNEIFRAKVEQELKNLNNEQIVNFAWRCAVRALPFLLSDSGNFDFWKNKDRQNHIYALFYALDFVASTTTSTTTVATAATAVDAAKAATTAATAAIAYASLAVEFTKNEFADSNISADFASHAAASASIAAYRRNINLELIILQDLNTILYKGIEENQQEINSLHTDLWDNFQKALEAEDCSYWGKLYKNIFENNFVLDKKALERRMNVPKGIREQGAAAVANYLEELEKGATRLNEARIIILGDKGSGKTCIARRLIDPDAQMTTDKESTAGVNTLLWQLEKENINVRIWDFAGHTVTHAVHQFFLSERCLYLMVYDGRTEERNRLEYWLDHMKNYGGGSKAIILVNKRDQHSVDISINTLREKYPIEGDYTFSIQDDKAELKAFRNDVAKYIKNNPSWKKQEIPTNYYQVKEELEKLFVKGEKEKGQEHITKEKFEEIAKRYNVDDTEKLLKDLHFLGVSLWYENMEKYDTLILNPEWISHGVYKIINWVNEEKKYDITLTDFAIVFGNDGNRYPEDKHEFLFDLMKHYELAYETEKGRRLIIPHLLKEDRPAKLPDFPVGDSLMLRYKAEQPLPPDTISRFIVRHNQEIKKEKRDYLVWRYGVVLDDGNGSIALVREDDRTISVSVKGQDKTNYISALRETLNDIYNSYKSEKPELQYRVEQLALRKGQKPVWLSEEVIQNHVNANKTGVFDSYSNQYIPIQVIVESLNINLGYGTMTIAGRDIDKSTHNSSYFYNCNIGLQGNLNELARLLSKGGNKEEAKELEDASKALEQIEGFKSKVEVKKKGVLNSLKYLVADLTNEDSKLHKIVKGIKNGITIAQDIAIAYNDIAQWAG